jgi:hypothetical protein
VDEKQAQNETRAYSGQVTLFSGNQQDQGKLFFNI